MYWVRGGGRLAEDAGCSSEKEIEGGSGTVLKLCLCDAGSHIQHAYSPRVEESQPLWDINQLPVYSKSPPPPPGHRREQATAQEVN